MKRTFITYLVCLIICFLGFTFTSKSEFFDMLMLRIYAAIMKVDLTGLEINTLKDYLFYLFTDGQFSSLLGNNVIIISILKSSKAWIMGIVQLVYNLVFLIIWMLIYYVLRILIGIGNGIFNSKRRHIKKMNKDFANGVEYQSYHKEKNKGGLVGLAKSFISCSIAFTLLGSSLYTIAGKGKQYLADMDFGNEVINFSYNTYKSVESYGSYGIYGLLNSITDNIDPVIEFYRSLLIVVTIITLLSLLISLLISNFFSLKYFS